MTTLLDAPQNRLIVFAVTAVLAVGLGCSDDVSPQGMSEEDCTSEEVFDPIQNLCVDEAQAPDVDAGDSTDDTSANDGQNEPNGLDDCQGLQCDQVSCDPGQTPASISGTVTIPSGNLPLPDVTVYVPSELPLEPVTAGASCERCDDQLSAVPMVQTTTNLVGDFQLINVPVGDEIPLVIEVGKWRRQITVDSVQACQDNPIEDDSRTRLPSNTDEGEIPRIAVTTGGWDAMECLVRKIGVDASEFSTDDGDGRIHLFAGRGGTDRFASFLNAGQSFTDAWDWWDDVDNLLDYDIVINSCEGNANLDDKPQQARDALQEFTELGGRVFLSHWHNVWLNEGPDDFQTVAEWGNAVVNNTETGLINTEFPKGETLHDWMHETYDWTYNTGSSTPGEFQINEARGTVSSIDPNIAQEWVSIDSDGIGWGSGGGEFTQQFSFNTPVNAAEEQQCGRVVFSDFHVVDGDNSSPNDPFPTGCTSASLTQQEKALVFLFFDLSRCIIPDDKKHQR